MASTKLSQPTNDIAAPPPSYEMHTTYTPASESDTRPNGYSLFRDIVTVPTPDTSSIRYQTLRRKFKYSVALNIVLILVVLPLAFIGFALIHNADSAGNDNTKDASAAIIPLKDASSVLDTRTNAPPRRCVTGFTIIELNDAFNNIQKNHDNKGRIWMTPCSEVEGLDYTNKGLMGEFDYIVT